MGRRFSNSKVPDVLHTGDYSPAHASFRPLTNATRATRQRGFTYLALLFVIAIMGVLAAVTSALSSIDQRRQKEKELLFVGNQFRQAIGSFYERSPGTVKQYPGKLEDLLEDNRFVVPIRHLRRVYRDPITLNRDWGIVRGPDGGIAGVYPGSTADPMKKGNFDEVNADLVGKTAYRDWRFVYSPPPSNATK